MSLAPRGFGSDNHAGIHPQILKAMIAANQDHAPSYGIDSWSQKAQDLFKKHFGEKAQGFFVFNGTAANALALSVLIQSGEAIFCSDVSHLHVDEAAAPEFFTRGKVWALPCMDGKLSLQTLKDQWIRRGDVHFAQPQVLSLTQPTEYGTIYKISELKEICDWAKSVGLKIHIDGARLGVAAASLGVSLREITSDLGVDAISFGGTKNGMMGAEAVIVFDPAMAKRLSVMRKQSGQLPSKSRFLAAQFIAYLENDLWKEIARGSVDKARRLAAQIEEIPGVEITHPVEGNALFVRLPREKAKLLKEKFFFYVWDEKTWECRWMISWDLKDSDLEEFVQCLREVMK